MDSKKVILISILSVFLITLILLSFQKYNKLNNDLQEKTENKYDNNQKEETKKEENEKEENEKEENEDLIKHLYKMVSIDDVNEKNIGYYLNENIDINNIDNDLLSYLVLKNTDLKLNGQSEKTIKVEEVDNILNKIFNTDEIKLSSYEAVVKNYKYNLNYVTEYEKYVLTYEKKSFDNSSLIKSIKNYEFYNDKIEIIEEYKLKVDGEEKNGDIKYIFNKGEKDYYLEKVVRILNN